MEAVSQTPTNLTRSSDWSTGRDTGDLQRRNLYRMKDEELTRRTRPKQAVCDKENVFYSRYRSTFEKQFLTDSGSERFKMDTRVEKRIVTSFYVPLGKSLGETYADIKKAYDSECLNKTTVNLWHKLYRDGRDIVGLDPHGGTKKSMITEVKQSSRSCPREWRTVFVMMVSTSKKNHVRIVIVILNKEVTKFALCFLVGVDETAST